MTNCINKWVTTILAIAVAILFMTATTRAQVAHTQPSKAEEIISQRNVAAKRYAAAIRRGEAAIRALMKLADIPGLTVAVAINGEIIWSEGFGYADLEQRVPVTSLTRFRIASVTKLMTAAAVARLHEEGKLDLDAPVQRYVPAFPDKGHVITARLLAGQLGGIRNVVEGASGQDFLTCLRERVFAPLKLRDTIPDTKAILVPHRAGFYQRSDTGHIINAPYLDSSYKWGAGGLLSTAEDVTRFGSAHLRAGFLKSETLEMLFTSQRTSDGQPTGVGIGWRSMTDLSGRRFVHHSGSQQGSRSVLLVYRDAGVVIALVTNLTGTPIFIEGTAQALGEEFLRVIEGQQTAQSKPAGSYEYTLETKDGPETMQHFIFALGIVLIAAAFTGRAQNSTDADAIKQAALDYIEGWYEGNAERMERALHPELAKRMVRTENGKSALQQMSALTLIHRTRQAVGKKTPPEQRQKEVIWH